MGKSAAEQLAALPPKEQEEVLEGLDAEALQWDFQFWGRPEQLRFLNEAWWRVGLYIAGRGSGKTRTGSEWVREQARKYPGSRGFLVARTAADVRDVQVSGESGIVNICPPSERPEWEPSKRRLVFPNGTTVIAFTSAEPDQLRGPQAHWSWADEVAAWEYKPDDSGLNAWDNLTIATRLGDAPQILATTTPKRTEFMRELIALEKRPDTLMMRGSTRDNTANLSQAYLDTIYGLYAGTRLAQQELDGLLLDDIEGALLDMAVIDNARLNALPPGAPLIVVGVDPSVAERPRDECGIIVAGATNERHMYQRNAFVLEDASVLGSPMVWSEKVAAVARRWRAPVIAETNQGAALVKMTLQSVDPSIRVLEVHARQGKATRAEPVVSAYQQGRVHHVGYFPEYEDQFCSWVPETSSKSPDRVDAAVHALTALLVKQPKGLYAQGLRMKSMGDGRMPSSRQSRTGRGVGMENFRPKARGGRVW